MDEPKDDTLKIRVPSELKGEVERIAEADPETDNVSEWVRRELRTGLQVAKTKLDGEL